MQTTMFNSQEKQPNVSSAVTINDQHNVLDATTGKAGLSKVFVYTAKRVKVTRLVGVPFESIFNDIRTSDELQFACGRIRPIADTTARRKMKEALLPYFIPAHFKNNKRDQEHFDHAEYMVQDLDHLDGNYDTVRERLIRDPETLMLFRSPSGDGLKRIIKCNRIITSVDEYKQCYEAVAERFFQTYGVKLDPACAEAARATFLSYDPDAYVNWNPVSVALNGAAQESGYDFGAIRSDNTTEILSAFEPQAEGSRTHSLTRQVGLYYNQGFNRQATIAATRAWNRSNLVPLDDGKLVYTVNDLYDRNDKNARYERFWSYGSDVFEFGMAGDEFFMTQIGRKKFEILVNAMSQDQREKAYADLVRKKHLRYLKRVDHIGDIAAERSFFEVDPNEGVISVHHGACPVDVKDNVFIENYLSERFGSYANVVKQWLAVYTYSNYRKLPTMVLMGDRGTGKNKFAELVMTIYPSLSQFWHGKEKNFTPEVEKKLLVADESVSRDESQYNVLKKYSGQDEATVNQKYMKEYKIRNNMNLMILSNSERPIFVERMELPKDERNNQFLVYKMKPIQGPVDVDLANKLKVRLGHYLRTELKTVWEKIKNNTDCRYSILVPITAEEKSLFDLNKSDLDEEVDKILDRMHGDVEEKYESFFKAGYLPKSFVANYQLPRQLSKNDIFRRLKERGYCEPSKSIDEEKRVKIGSMRERCLVMTEKLKKWYLEQKEAA